MAAPLARVEQDPPRGAERHLDETVRALFRRLPDLAGFSVIDAGTMAGEREAGRLEGDLSLADITVASGYPWDFFGDIAVALVDLIEERPEVRELMRGRTFTRTRH